jgi:F-type H+-transporting ATPase subunit b
VKNLMRAITAVTFLSLALSLQARTVLQAPHDEAAKPAQQTSTPESETEQGKPGQALAERSNEAAGRDARGEKPTNEQEEQLKHSKMVELFAKLVGLKNHPQLAYWIFVCLNFAILAAAIPKIWVFGLHFFDLPLASEHRANVKKKFEDARKSSDDANRRLAAIESKLARLDSDIAAIRSEAEAVNKAEETRLQTSIEDERKKVVTTAQQEIEAAATQARRELKMYVADLAVALAEKNINVDEATDKTLVRSFVEQMPSGKDGR